MSPRSRRGGADRLGVACVQMRPAFGDRGNNLATTLERIEAAAGLGARLVVLPELCVSGYMFESRAEAFALAEPIPDGETVSAWADACRRLDIHVVGGLAERDGDVLFNSAVLVGPDGWVGTFRKLHLWNEENLYFERGNLGVPVFHIPVGRIAMAICYDGWFPETFRLAALQGADIVCVPTNWVPIPGQVAGRPAMATTVTMASANVNSMFIAAADRVGDERGQPFIGQSLIVDQAGWPVAGPASEADEEIIVAEVDLADARRKRNWNAFNQPLRDRRTDVYDELLGADIEPGWH